MNREVVRLFWVLLLASFLPSLVFGGEDKTIEGAILESQVMSEKGDFQQAREILEQAARDTPGEPKLYLHLGDVYRELGWRNEAAAAYRRAVQIHPGFSKAFEALATLNGQQGKWDEAIKAYQQLATIDPSSARFPFEIAMIYRNQGLVAQESEALQQAYRLNPQFVAQSARLRQVELDELILRQTGDDHKAESSDGANVATAASAGEAKPVLTAAAGHAQAAVAVRDEDDHAPVKKEEARAGNVRAPALLLLLAVLLLAWVGVKAWHRYAR